MRLITTVFVGLVATVAICIAEDSAPVSVVDLAIAEARKSYEAKLVLATINGAQSTARKFINKSTPETERMGKIYSIYRDAKDILIKKYKLNSSEAETLINQARQAECPVTQVVCSATERYRRANGTCNNLVNPLWGSTYQPLNRQVAPQYEGTLNDEPHGGLVSTLPQPRAVSLGVHKGEDMNNTDVTHMIAQFGQFLDHDISLTPEGGKTCCVEGGPNVDPDPDCWHVSIPETDPFYANRTRCLDYTRSTPTCLVATHREQMNIITSFIDGSQVYGSDPKLVKLLRKFSGGELAENGAIRGFLPWTSDVDPAVSTPGTIVAGDRRANEMPGLTVMHSLFLREHNRIAREFSAKTNWSDEQIFQETRRLVGAELQQITYNEYLPSTLGPAAMTKYGLTLQESSTYDPTVNPTIFNSFATAAYRFGHTLVNGLIFMMMNNTVVDQYHVRDNYFKPIQIIDQTTNTMPGFDLILNGLIRQSAQAGDSIVSEDMTNYLFQTISNTFGSDLAARNVQRGRDHGLPGYHEFRLHCNMTPLTTWENKPAEIDQPTWDKLRLAYNGTAPGTGTPLDIDLYTGGLAQTPVSGGQAGPTFVCLMGLQFQKLKDGDRFFFTHVNQTGSFTVNQLAQLRKRTLGDVICENSDLKETPRNVFKKESTENPMVPCIATSRQKLDIALFEDDTITTATTVDDTITTARTVNPNGAIGLKSSFSVIIALIVFYATFA